MWDKRVKNSHFYLTVPPRLSRNSDTLTQNPGPDRIGPPNEKTIVRWVDKLGRAAAHRIIGQLSCSAFHFTYQQRPLPRGTRRTSVQRRTIEFLAIELKAVAIIRTEAPWLAASIGAGQTLSFWWSRGKKEKGNWVKFTSMSSLLGAGLNFRQGTLMCVLYSFI